MGAVVAVQTTITRSSADVAVSGTRGSQGVLARCQHLAQTRSICMRGRCLRYSSGQTASRMMTYVRRHQRLDGSNLRGTSLLQQAQISGYADTSFVLAFEHARYC